MEKKSISEALKAIYSISPAENEQYFRAYGISLLSCPEVLHATGIVNTREKVSITFEKNNQEFTIDFKPTRENSPVRRFGWVKTQGNWLSARQETTTLPLYLKHLDKNYFFEYLEEYKTIYVRQSSVRDDRSEKIKEFYSRVFDFVEKNDVDKFILDVRLNGGGNNYKNRPVITGLIQAKKINQKGKLFTIIGRRTFSACQNLVNEIETYTKTIFVGEPTAENVNFFGDVRIEKLPNSQLPVYLSYLWWQNKDPRDKREWTAPQIAIEPSFEDFKSNHDPVVEVILNYRPKAPVAERIKNALALNGYESVEKLAFEIKNDSQNKYLNFEIDINELAYDLMEENRLEAAFDIFMLNTKLYPQSANVWDSLGEIHAEMGNVKLAIKNYQKSLSLDSTNENAKEMIAKLKKM